MSQKPKTITQAQYWHRQYKVFATTNLHNQDLRRSKIGGAGLVKDLKLSCISTKGEGATDWSTHELGLDRMLNLMIPECRVGRHGTSAKDCMRAIRDAVIRHGAADTCLCKLYQKDGNIGLNVSGLRTKEKDITDDIRHDVNVLASNGGTVELGQDVFVVKWQVMLTAE